MDTRCLWLILVLATGTALGQAPLPEAAADPPSSSIDRTVATEPEPAVRPSGSDAATSYAPSLDGTGLIPLDHSVRSRLLLGGGYSGGYDTRPEDVGSAPGSGISIISPYLGVAVNRENTQYVFQYLPTFTHYTNDRYQGGSLHSGMVNVAGNPGERWDWEAHGVGMHGQDSVRLLAPQPTIAIGDIAGTSPTAASIRNNSGIVTYIVGSGRLSYRVREHDTLSAVATNSYGTSTSSPGDNIVATLRGIYSHEVTARFSWQSYAQAARYYGVNHCWSEGAGAGLLWRPGEHSILQLSGGPQFDSASCGTQQNASYRVAYGARLSERSQAYLSSQRDTASVYIGPGLWEQSVTAGYQRRVNRTDTADLNVGYVTETLYQQVQKYHGIYAGASYSRKLPGKLSIAFSYRYFDGGWSGSSFNRNTALVSLNWLPTGARLFQ